MSDTYMVIRKGTAEIVRDNITSEQLQAADRLLKLSKRLSLHAAASDGANARDRVARYGDAYRRPAGVARPYRYKLKPITVSRTVADLAGGIIVETGKTLLECCSFGLLSTAKKKR